MPGVYKLKRCSYSGCHAFHRQRGPFCCQACANKGRDVATKEKIKDSIIKSRNKFNAWYENLSPERKKEFQETKHYKKLIEDLKDIIKDCQCIIDDLEFNKNLYDEQYKNNPVNPKLIRLIYTACPPGYEVDHIIPKARGGLDHQDNFQYLFWEDNVKKGKKLESEVTFTLRNINWKDAIEEKNGEYYIKEEWFKKILNDHPFVSLSKRVSKTSNLISEITQSSDRTVAKPQEIMVLSNGKV